MSTPKTSYEVCCQVLQDTDIYVVLDVSRLRDPAHHALITQRKPKCFNLYAAQSLWPYSDIPHMGSLQGPWLPQEA